MEKLAAKNVSSLSGCIRYLLQQLSRKQTSAAFPSQVSMGASEVGLPGAPGGGQLGVSLGGPLCSI